MPRPGSVATQTGAHTALSLWLGLMATSSLGLPEASTGPDASPPAWEWGFWGWTAKQNEDQAKLVFQKPGYADSLYSKCAVGWWPQQKKGAGVGAGVGLDGPYGTIQLGIFCDSTILCALVCGA